VLLTAQLLVFFKRYEPIEENSSVIVEFAGRLADEFDGFDLVIMYPETISSILPK